MRQNIFLKIAILFLSVSASAKPSIEPAKYQIENVELQWLICEPSIASLEAKIQNNLGIPSARDVYYLETRNLELMTKSAVARIRVSNGKGKSTVKLNFQNDQNLPWHFITGKDSKCEWDAHGSVKKVGCSVNAKLTNLSAPLSMEQQNYLQQEAGFAEVSTLVTLGPAKAQEWKWFSDDLEVDFSLEETKASGGFNSQELSTRVAVNDAEDTQRRVQEWLTSHGVNLCPTQSGKGEALIRALLKEKFP